MTFLFAAALVIGQTDADAAKPAKADSAAPSAKADSAAPSAKADSAAPSAKADSAMMAPADDNVDPPNAEDTKEKNRKAAAKQAMPYLMLLTALAILLLFLGGILFIRRMGEKLTKTKPRKPVKYFDMKVEPLAEEPPHEPTAEERWREPDDPRP